MKRQLKDYTESLEALIKEKIELQDHLSSLGLMIGSISHGLKGLLTGLDGGMYLVESGFTKENHEQIKEGWQTVKLMVDRIRKMVLDILYYAKERKLNWETVDAHSFSSEVVQVVEPKITAKGIEFVPELDESIGEIEIDAGYLHSAIINIIDNAVDACLKDTEKDYHKIVFSVRKNKEHILFEVFDNGTGMDSETTAKLFTPFFSSKGRKGTGLGLFISNKIIDQHGGKITVKSTPGQGTLFAIHIPLFPPDSLKNAEPENGHPNSNINGNAARS